MSQTHIRLPKPPSHRRMWLEVSLVTASVILVSVFWLAKAGGWFLPDFDSTAGNVLETRIVVDHSAESSFGGKVYYRLEAHVQYQAESDQIHDRWLTAYDITRTRELLVMEQDKHSKNCRVYWIRNHPETAKCQLL